MREIKSILCPVDFSEFSTRAYRYALALAEHYQARLVVQHVVELWQYPSLGFATSLELYEEFCQSLGDKCNEQLREFVKHNAHREIHPELLVQHGMAPDTILSFAQTQKVDVIVMGTHGRRGYDRLMLGSVTDRVMRRAPCPVLAVCNAPQDSLADTPIIWNRILFCADFSSNSGEALDCVISAAAEYHAELTLLHVLEDAPSHAKKDKAIAAALEQLEKLIPTEARKALKIKTAVRIGKPYRQIIQFVEEQHTDMVTMGVHGRGALDLAVFGSTTYRVMQLGHCPVLVVHV